MRILLLYPSWTGGNGLFSYFSRRQGTWPPLNLALMAAIAEQYGHNVAMIDGEVERLSMPDMIKKALDHKPDLIGLNGMSPYFHNTTTLAKGLKEANNKVPIAVGGSHMTIMKEKAFFPEFDFGFIGQAEDSWPQFLESYENGKELSAIKGLIFRKNDELKNTGEANMKKDLDSLPDPARHLLKMERYKIGTLQGMKNFTSIQGMRGCPWECIFCASKELKTNIVSYRSAMKVFNEIREVVSKFNIRHFYFTDEVLTLNRERIADLCDMIINEELSITFEGATRANLIDEELLIKLKSAGLIRIAFGLETVNAGMRDTMKKKVPLEEYTKANCLLNKHGIEVLNSVILGLPGETRGTAKSSLKWLSKAKDVKQVSISIAVPYPGTEFHKMAKSGTHGVELVTEDLSAYRRYGNAVIKVNDLAPQDLIELQNDGFVSIYSAPWRIKPMWKKHGTIGCLLTLLRLVKLITRRLSLRRIPASKGY
jgi:radical SAM superfamily enzyme YgiQ (UPF0313 family)